MSKKVERRAFPAEIRTVRQNNKRKIVGHAAVFDQEADLGWFREKVAPGAFADSIAKDDIRALWNHNSDIVLGRNRAGTLVLREDETGLLTEIEPPSWAESQLETIERGDVSQMSFAFQVLAENFEKQEGQKDLRIVTRAKLFDVSPVTYPAYATTDVSVRGYNEWLGNGRTQAATAIPEALVCCGAASGSNGHCSVPGAYTLRILRTHYRDEVEATAHHEAAHAVVFRLVGLGVNRVYLLYQRGNGPGGVRPANGYCLARRGWAHAQPIALLAGALAERRWSRKPQFPSGDLKGARMLLRRQGRDTPADLEREIARAQRLVDQHWGLIHQVAQRLLRRGELSGREVEKLVLPRERIATRSEFGGLQLG